MIRWPSTSSYRGRYAYIALFLIVFLFGAAIAGRYYVINISAAEIDNIEERANAAGFVTDSLRQLHNLENWLRRFVIDPDGNPMQTLNTYLDLYDRSLQRLSDSEWIQRDPLLNAVNVELRKDTVRLRQEATNLVEVRTHIEEWFPVFRILEEDLLPHNADMLVSLDIIRSEINETQTVKSRLEVTQHVATMREAWSSMTSELRLLIANRFGFYASQRIPEMLDRNINIEIYAESFQKNHQLLKKMASQGMLGFEGVSALTNVERNFNSWMDSFEDLSEKFKDTDWRRDLLILRNDVIPVIERMHQRISSLELELDTQSARGITLLGGLIDRMSFSMLWLAFGGLFIVWITYVTLQRTLLKPIANITHALKLEARGASETQIPASEIQETRDLITAYNEMSQQVRQRQQDLDHMMHHDTLTQLPNRILFRERLQQSIRIAERDDTLVGLMFIDLDKFKQINDSIGHVVGDQLLVVVSRRLQSVVSEVDTVARFSGDEFAILVDGVKHRSELVPMANHVMEVFKDPIVIDDYELHTSASIGISVAPIDDNTADKLIRNADSAMYEAKRAGRARFAFFSKEMTEKATEYLMMEHELRRAAENREFAFYYQPIVGFENELPGHYEALMRWVRPNGEVVTPLNFLQILEDSGLINRVFRDLLDDVSDFQRAQNNNGVAPTVSVNLAADQLRDEMFREDFISMLESNFLLPTQLIVEVTENTLANDIADAKQFLNRLSDAGVKIALDDYGTGQSSLAHLREFSFDLIKIDREFIRDITVDPSDADLVAAVVQLAHTFGMRTIAEGVETGHQLDYLKDLGCDYVQGYLMGKPMPREQVEFQADNTGGKVIPLKGL